METYHVFGRNVKPAVVNPPYAAPLDEPISIEQGSVIVMAGNFGIGTALAPITDDEILIHVNEDATLIIDGDLSLYRDVNAANPLILCESGSKIIVTGDTILSREGVGAGGIILASVDSLVKFIGSTDVVACEAVFTADGGFLTCSRDSIAYFGQLLFNGGADLDMGAYAHTLLEFNSRLHVTDVAGASDALNDPAGNPGVPTCLGVMLTSGSKAFMDAYQANTGVGAGATHANARDTKVGNAAVADWGGSEVLTDLGAGAPEMCMVYKP